MVSQVTKETMRACLSCPLCDCILCDATTISECLHTFCRKCIYEKITEDEIECCPVCSIDLGGTPLEKLRPDHNLQDLRAKIFPLNQRKVNAPEPPRRKERSLSFLVVTTPKVSEQAGTKAATRKELRDSGPLSDRSVKKEESLMGDLLESTSSPGIQNNKQDGDEPWDPTLDWKPLNFLVEVANRTKPLKSSASQGSGSKSEHSNASHKQSQGKKTKTKDHENKCKREGEKSNNSETATPKRLPRTQRKRPAATYGDSSPRPDESSAKRVRRNGPVWFSLVASSDQEGKTSLPRVPSIFLRIRDGSIPVSFIQKYLMRKLDLRSETEVEIRCMGEPVVPTLKLQKLVDIWLQRSSKRQKFDTSIGSSAKDYMMVLVYGRKLPKCNK